MKVIFKKTSPNYRQKLSTVRIMNELTLGLLAVVAFSIFYFFTKLGSDYGIKAILIYVVAVVTALVTEFVYHSLSGKKGKEAIETIKYSFPIVTALILALTLPIGTPLYVVGIGSFVAIFFGKLIYGGFGQNVFNPALVGRVLVHLSFGAQLTNFLGDSAPDIIAGATPTTALKSAGWLIPEGFMDLGNLFSGMYSAAIGETSTILILVIGVILAWRKVIEPRITIAYLGTVWIVATVVAMVLGQNVATYGLIHIALGGAAFGAVFMATDPVTSPTSPLGKILFGIGAGLLTMLIRVKANYPEGVLFSILLMNMFTPFIESRTLGRTSSKTGKQIMAICTMLVVAIATVGGAALTLEDVEAEDPGTEEPGKPEEPTATVIGQQDGGYVVESEGFHGNMKILVTIQDDLVTVKVLEHEETEEYGKAFIEGKPMDYGDNTNTKVFYETIIANSFSKSVADSVDTKTGATYTANAIINAVKAAIKFDDEKIEIDANGVAVVTVEGFHGDMKVEVTVDQANKTVKSVKVLEHEETDEYGKAFIEGKPMDYGEIANTKVFYEKVLAGTPFGFDEADDIDTKTGATFTSAAIMEAVKRVIASAQ